MRCKARSQQGRSKRREPVWSLVLNVRGIDSDTTGALLWSVVNLLFKDALCKKQKAQIASLIYDLRYIYIIYIIYIYIYTHIHIHMTCICFFPDPSAASRVCVSVLLDALQSRVEELAS